MATTQKALSIAHKLKAELLLRPVLSGLTIVEGLDSTSGDPVITIGTVSTTGNACAYIKVMPVSWALAKDIFGNAQQVYAPHNVKVLKEAPPGSGLTAGEILQIEAACAATGCEVKLYQSSSGGGVLVADIDNEAKLVSGGKFNIDPTHILISSQ